MPGPDTGSFTCSKCEQEIPVRDMNKGRDGNVYCTPCYPWRMCLKCGKDTRDYKVSHSGRYQGVLCHECYKKEQLNHV